MDKSAILGLSGVLTQMLTWRCEQVHVGNASTQVLVIHLFPSQVEDPDICF